MQRLLISVLSLAAFAPAARAQSAPDPQPAADSPSNPAAQPAQPSPEPSVASPNAPSDTAPPANAPNAPTPPVADKHLVTGSKWDMSLYGFIELDSAYDTTESFNDLAANGTIARPG